MGRTDGRAVGNCLLAALALTARPPHRLSAQDVDRLAIRFAAMTAISGYEQAMGDSLLALVPGSVRDRLGNVTLTLGRGAPKRLAFCSLDEPGYVVGNITDDGFLRLRRVPGPAPYPLFDQAAEGHRVTLFGDRGPVPGVVAVRSVHLTRNRPTGIDQPFTVDDAYVDVGAMSRAAVEALGMHVLTPVALAKRPHRYGRRLFTAPDAGERTACAALAEAALVKPKVRGTVVVAFTVQSLFAHAGADAVRALQGPFDDEFNTLLDARYPHTPVETVSLEAADSLRRELLSWMER